MTEVLDKEICLEAFQERFFQSRARFPGFLSAWGTGKTMTAIFKGCLLSSAYSNNLGLIVRKKFTDLRDSTLKDFERYTGLHVPMSTKEITLPGTNSTIMFRHGDELSGLQNVNLGWVYMEQAEEFPTAEQFDMLRGRLRRELVPTDDYQSNIPAYDELVQWLQEQPTGFRQMMIGANAAGHNWTWYRWIHKPRDEYEAHEAVTEDNIDNLPADFIADIRALELDSPRKYNRYALNSYEDYDMEGAFYAGLMSNALKEGRVDIPDLYDNGEPVYTAWDLGTRASDTTVIWCFQRIKNEVWFIDYYENYGEGMDHYNNWLNSKDYDYRNHYLPHDAKAAQMGKTIQRRDEVLRELREGKHESVKIVQNHNIEDRIAHARKGLPRCRFSSRCETGVHGLNNYKAKRNEILSTENKPVFSPEPLHDWSSNAADGFGYALYGVDHKGYFSHEDLAA